MNRWRLSLLVLCLLATVVSAPAVVRAQTDIYTDNRSSPEALMTSFVNALNRKEYLRAYSYWEPDAQQLAPFPQFEQGYANTQAVQLMIGSIGGGVGAGQTYYSVPVTLYVQTTNGGAQTFVGCYILHLGSPAAQGAPPFRPLGIMSAQVQQVPNDSNTVNLMSQVCANQNVSTASIGTPTPAADPTLIDASRYIDDRSGPIEVLRSLFNAINRREYVRAYSYWEADAPQLAAYADFEVGYANTTAVQLYTGNVTNDAGAGQFYYSVPVTLSSQTTNGITQTFVGCYRLHLASPAAQATPPFRPLGIASASVQQVPNDANTVQMMQQACG
ncbi:MAG: hypothetical protein IT324_31145 [Anaerolineae bacterium]|nr:hypothetical protein [Anaerolineae bacterium]